MSNTLLLILALIAGAALGTFFFGGLWWTISRAVASSRPAVWFMASLLLRTSVVLVGFFVTSRGDWQRLLACLAGFFLARLAVTRLTRVPAKKGLQLSKQGGS